MARKSPLLWAAEALEARRLLSAGDLDVSFGKAGQASFDLTKLDQNAVNSSPNAVAVQGDGKTVVVGRTSNGTGGDNVAILRLNFDGSLDTTFGSGGLVRKHFGGSDSQSIGMAVAIDHDGDIIVAGQDDTQNNMLIMRLLPNGSLDSSWAGGGVQRIGFGIDSAGVSASALTIQNDGKIVVVGRNASGFFSITNEFAVLRLNANGQRDDSFNGDGTQSISFDGGDVSANAVTVDYSGTPKANPAYGTIIVSGQFDDGSNSKFAVARLRPNGDIDQSFHEGGTFEFAPPHDTGASATGVVVAPNGKIVVSGSAGAHRSNGFVANGTFAVTRLTSNGLLDSSFAGGKTWATVGSNARASSLLVGQGNRLILGGVGDSFNMFFAAFTADGVLDSSFGAGGTVTVSNGGTGANALFANGMAYGPGNRFVATGGPNFNTVRILDTGGRLVHVTAINPSASEVGPTPGTFFVFREERLPVPTRVFFRIGGTASAPLLFSVLHKTNDYTLDGLTIPTTVIIGGSSTPFVDIPANQTFAIVTLTPIDRKLGDGNKTATFTIVTTPAAYDIESPSSVVMNIADKPAPQITLNATADALVRGGASASTNFGRSTQLLAKTDAPGSGLNRRTFLKFDLSSITTINSVKLQLFGNLSSSASTSVKAGVFAVSNTSWSETGINWSNQPTVGANLATATILDNTPRLYTWDITAYVKAQKAAGHNIITLAIENLSVTSNFDIFNSREAASNRPQLMIA